MAVGENPMGMGNPMAMAASGRRISSLAMGENPLVANDRMSGEIGQARGRRGSGSGGMSVATSEPAASVRPKRSSGSKPETLRSKIKAIDAAPSEALTRLQDVVSSNLEERKRRQSPTEFDTDASLDPHSFSCFVPNAVLDVLVAMKSSRVKPEPTEFRGTVLFAGNVAAIAQTAASHWRAAGPAALTPHTDPSDKHQ